MRKMENMEAIVVVECKAVMKRKVCACNILNGSIYRLIFR